MKKIFYTLNAFLLPTLSLAAPANPSNLQLTALSGSSVSLSWDNESNDDKVGFKIFRDETLIARTASGMTSFIDTGLTPNTDYNYVIKATDEAQDVIDTIVERHNVYRALEFTDSPLLWDDELANHAQTWANYLATNYTANDSGLSPHASRFQADLHNEDDYEEGENIAWGRPSRAYFEENPVDISSVAVAQSYLASVDAWAAEKAYYDYATNTQVVGYENEAIGHYTQMVWQKTKKIGCGKATSTTDYAGDWIVCRYTIAGNRSINGVKEKPYCLNYTNADLYSEGSLAFTEAMISGKSFAITKIIEDRTTCTRDDTADSTLTFTGVTVANIPDYNVFNTSDGSNLWSMNFDNVAIDDGILTLTNNENDRYMTLKLIGDFATHYSVEAYWWVVGAQYNRRAILKLAK